jgi:predicted nucleic acid-binding protein
MEENVLVDSSFFINRLRQRKDPFLELAGADEKYEFYVCGVVQTEVCVGMLSERLYRQALRQFEIMCWVPTTSRVWERATEMAWGLARNGIVVKVPDLVIAVSALEADAAVLTYDSDFGFVPGLRVIDRLD